MAENNKTRKMRLRERILCSRTMRGIFRIQVGGSFFRVLSKDVRIPSGTTVHLFDYLLYRKTNK